MQRTARTTDDVKTSFYLPRAVLRALKHEAARTHVSLRTVLLDAVALYLKTRRPR
jgi:hypothetical protein